MDFGRAFTYVTEDPDWIKKIGIAGLIMLIPLVGSIILLGWGLEITRRVINHNTTPLADWDDFGAYLSSGFKAFIALLAYCVPIGIIYGCGLAITLGLIGATGNADSSTQDAMAAIATGSMFCMYCFVIAYAIFVALIVPPAFANLAATGELGAAFRFSEIFGILRAAIGPFLLSLLVIALASSVLSSIGSLLCGIGLLFTSAYTLAISSHLHGQAYNIAKATMGGSAMEQSM